MHSQTLEFQGETASAAANRVAAVLPGAVALDACGVWGSLTGLTELLRIHQGLALQVPSFRGNRRRLECGASFCNQLTFWKENTLCTHMCLLFIFW